MLAAEVDGRAGGGVSVVRVVVGEHRQVVVVADQLQPQPLAGLERQLRRPDLHLEQRRLADRQRLQVVGGCATAGTARTRRIELAVRGAQPSHRHRYRCSPCGPIGRDPLAVGVDARAGRRRRGPPAATTHRRSATGPVSSIGASTAESRTRGIRSRGRPAAAPTPAPRRRSGTAPATGCAPAGIRSRCATPACSAVRIASRTGATPSMRSSRPLRKRSRNRSCSSCPQSE